MLDKVDVAAVRRAVTALARRPRRPPHHLRRGGRALRPADRPDRPPPLALTTPCRSPPPSRRRGLGAPPLRRHARRTLRSGDGAALAGRTRETGRARRPAARLLQPDRRRRRAPSPDAELRHLLVRERPARGAEPDYADYAATQAALAASGRFDAPLAWWRKRLAGGRRPAGATAARRSRPPPLRAGARAPPPAAPSTPTPRPAGRRRRSCCSPSSWPASATSRHHGRARRRRHRRRPLPGTRRWSAPSRARAAQGPPAGGRGPLPVVHGVLAEAMEQEPVPHQLLLAAAEAETP